MKNDKYKFLMFQNFFIKFLCLFDEVQFTSISISFKIQINWICCHRWHADG